MMIDEIEQKIINILPTSNTMFDEIDYSILEKRKEDWIKLSEITHSIVLVFDCYTNKFVFVSDNIPKLYGVDSRRLFVDGHRQVIELIHPDDIDYGLLVRKKIYSILRSFSDAEKMNYKAIHEMRIRNVRGEYIRIIEQEQVLELDKSGNIWLMLSVIDIDANQELEITKSHLYNLKTGDQIFIDLSDTLNEPLTNRELEVLRLMKQGLLSKEIADTLQISINTVNSHRQNILLKCEPDEKYTYQGANLLVDGLQGDDNYRSGRYIGLYGQNFDAIIDLQETKEISSVSLGTYLVPGDYIFGLTGLEIYGSNDGSAYSKIASKTIPVLEKGSKNNVLKRDTVSFGKTKARYVRIIGKNTPVLPKWHPGAGKRTYLFLDEITID